MIIIMKLADVTTPKGAKTKPMPPAISAPATLMIDDFLHPAYNDAGNF